jgi:hypothetical protein
MFETPPPEEPVEIETRLLSPDVEIPAQQKPVA